MVHEYIKYISHCESFVTHSGFSRVLATCLSTNSCKPLTSSGGGNCQGTKTRAAIPRCCLNNVSAAIRKHNCQTGRM